MKTLFPRLYQIYEESDKFHPDNCLSRLFGDDNPFQNDLSLYKYYESLFQKIDEENWVVFKCKVAKKLDGYREKGKIEIEGEYGKKEVKKKYAPLQCFDIFNEVHGYLFLKEEIGCEKVEFFEESNEHGQKTPDIKGLKCDTAFVLDVKTINRSDDDHQDDERVVNPIKGHVYPQFSPTVLRKLRCKICQDIIEARKQLAAFSKARKVIYFVIDPDKNYNTTAFHSQLCQKIRQDLGLIIKDIKICGIFSSPKSRPNNVDAPFNWSDPYA